MPELLITLLGVMFAAGTLLHTLKKLEKEVIAHDDATTVDDENSKG